MTERALKYRCEPRGLRKPHAAAYVGVGLTKFGQMVKDGRMPKPKIVDDCIIWDRFSLDVAFDDLSGETEANEWDEVLS